MRKAQIQMMETIAILFVFFVLVGLGFVFYARVLRGTASIEKEEQVQLGAVEVAQNAAFLPELQCSKDNAVTDSCIDLLKLEKAGSVITANSLEYSSMFGFSKIYVNEIYPDNTKSWTLYDNHGDLVKKLVINIPVSIEDVKSRKYSFGVLVVEAYTK